MSFKSRRALIIFYRVGFLVRPLQRMCVGGLLTASAFVVSGILELNLQVKFKYNCRRKIKEKYCFLKKQNF